MAIKSEVLEALAAAGATIEMLIAAVKADEARDEVRKENKREKDRERQRKYRSSHAVSRVTACDERDALSLDKEKVPTPLKETNLSPKENPLKGSKERLPAEVGHVWPADAFDRWYAEYPHKVGKGSAQAAFDKIRRSGKVPFESLLTGLANYRKSKPPHVDWCNPATWLNAERWDDAPATSAASPRQSFLERGRM